MKIGCLIYFYGKIYEKIGKIAVESFQTFHPDVDMFHVNKENDHLYESTKLLEKGLVKLGPYKYLLAAEIMKKKKYDKMIILGADTIVCSRLDEFMDDNESDILATLGYPYRYGSDEFETPYLYKTPGNSDAVDVLSLNADVVCFNNIKPILEIVNRSKKYPNMHEQAALNEVVWSANPDLNFSFQVVDAPYWEASAIYNVRSKGNITLPCEYQDRSLTPCLCEVPHKQYPLYEKPWAQSMNQFYVENDGGAGAKLFNKHHKQIKVWHYCEGFSALSDDHFEKLINNYIFKYFNEETKKFFIDVCAPIHGSSFFTERFSLK